MPRRSRITPPATMKLEKEIPRRENRACPPKRKMTRSTKATRTARKACSIRSLSDILRVRARKVAIPKKGSRITMSTTKDFRKAQNASTVSPRFHYREIQGIGKKLDGSL